MLAYTYLAEKGDISRIGLKELVDFNYLGCVYFNQVGEQVHFSDFNRTKVLLEDYRDLGIMFFDWNDIQKIPQDSYLGSCLEFFMEEARSGPFVSILSHREGVSPHPVFSPLTQDIELPEEKDRFSLRTATRASVERILGFLEGKSLRDFSYGYFHRKDIIIPNGPQIQACFPKRGEQSAALRKAQDFGISIGADTLHKATQCFPISQKKFEAIMELLDEEGAGYKLDLISPNHGTIRKLRKEIGLTQEQLCRKYKIGNLNFFDLLETEKLISVDAFRLIVRILEDVKPENMLPSDLIDFSQSSDFSQDP